MQPDLTVDPPLRVCLVFAESLVLSLVSVVKVMLI